MSSIIDNSINSAIVSGQFGLQKSFEGMTQASMNIAQRSAQTRVSEDGAGAVLANASVNGLQNIRETLPQSAGNLTSDLVSLKLNSLNAQASAKVLDVAFDTVGTIIDTLA